MNQSKVIAHLNYQSQGQEKILEQSLRGFITPDWMKEKGMWVCHGCGYIGCLEDSNCKSCGDEKFILSDSNRNLFIDDATLEFNRYKKQRETPKKLRPNGMKPIINTETGEKYTSVNDAAKKTGFSAAYVSILLNDKNKLKLKWL